MLEQAIHFKEESDSLYNLLINADNNSFKLNTQFKSWTINDVLYHLHVWNIASLLSLKNEKWKKSGKASKRCFTNKHFVVQKPFSCL